MTNKELDVTALVIDWGTTNFRAFAMDNSGSVIDKRELPLGLLQVNNGEFAKELESVLSNWLGNYKNLPIYMAGMVGSQKGWVNVDYVATQVGSLALANKAHRFELPWGAKATIIPGVSHQSATGAYDVMRGEEVQLFGLAKLAESTSFSAVLPGTHSKHARFENGELCEFATYMTGELFSVISQHSILGMGLSAQPLNEDSSAFIRGVKEGQTDTLTNTLFLARTHRLFNHISDAEVLDYLSGLLIGYELKSVGSNPIYLVGGNSLCARYTLACNELSISSTYMNGNDCFLAGMADLIRVINDDN